MLSPSGKNLTRRSLLCGTVAATTAMLAPRLAAAAPKRGGRMILGSRHGSTTDTTNPGMMVNNLQAYIVSAFSNTLTEILADRSVGPSLAASWDSTDATTWRFKLQNGVSFHDGRKLTPEDVIASLNFHRLPGSTSSVKPSADQIENMTPDGRNGVLIKLKTPNADLPAILNDVSFSIFPALGESIDWQSRNGTGAYILEDFEPGSRALLKRNPNYWRSDRGFADEVEFLSIPDATARSSALIAGQVQAIDEADVTSVDLLRSQPGIVIEEVAGPLHYTFPMLTDIAPFNDLNVRRAMKLAINRQEIIDKVLYGYGSLGNDHPIGPSYRYHAEDLEQNAYDPDKAKFHLSKAGMSTLSIDLHAADAAFVGAVDAALLYSAQAKKAGININVVREANDAYWDNIWLKKPFCACYWAGYPVESQIFAMGYAPDAAWNDTHWSEEKFEKFRQAAMSELDDGKRRDMYREMQTILRDDGGTVAFAFPKIVMARSDLLAHGPIPPYGSFDAYRIAERWWLA